MEVAAQLNPNSIYLIGLDLSYPTLQSHVNGAVGEFNLDKATLFHTASNDGGEVLTDTHLAYYINVIEQIICSYPDTCFYNLSLHGAKIKGTKIWR